MERRRTGATAPLARVEVSGLAGVPEVALELGPLTALIGTRGAGKSQLLVAISWLIEGRPTPWLRPGSGELRVAGVLAAAGGRGRVERRLAPSGEPSVEGRVDLLPRCTFLRAVDRIGPPMEVGGGEVGARIAGMLPRRKSDAAGAVALIGAVESSCRGGTSGEVLLIEEPEMLLTPQAQRYLYRLLRSFAEMGNQVLYSTWSPDLVDAAHHEEIVRLDLREGGSIMRRTDPQTLSDAERVRIQAEFDHERSEMFFAQKVVLVEGQTERLSLPFIFRALGHDPDAEGIAIVEVGGKGNLPLAARLLRQLAIPFVAVFDADHGAESAALDAQIRQAAGDAPTIRLVPDFEGAAGLRSHDEKVLHAWQRFGRGRARAIPGPLAEVVRTAVGL